MERRGFETSTDQLRRVARARRQGWTGVATDKTEQHNENLVTSTTKTTVMEKYKYTVTRKKAAL